MRPVRAVSRPDRKHDETSNSYEAAHVEAGVGSFRRGAAGDARGGRGVIVTGSGGTFLAPGAVMADSKERPDESDRNAERRRRRTVANLAFGAIKVQHAKHRSALERFVDRLNVVASSTPFLVAHAIWFGGWIAWNTGLLGFRPFDPYPFGLLTMVVSLEAIFLSIFVLMAQQRESAIAELREELGLQVSLRVEQEVTKTLQLVAGLYTRWAIG